MEKTLSLGAFEELSDNEVMVTEGGFVVAATVAVVGIVILGVGYGIGYANNRIADINKINDALAPNGLPNSNHIWTVL